MVFQRHAPLPPYGQRRGIIKDWLLKFKPSSQPPWPLPIWTTRHAEESKGCVLRLSPNWTPKSPSWSCYSLVLHLCCLVTVQCNTQKCKSSLTLLHTCVILSANQTAKNGGGLGTRLGLNCSPQLDIILIVCISPSDPGQYWTNWRAHTKTRVSTEESELIVAVWHFTKCLVP